MKEEEIKIGEQIVKLVTSEALPDAGILFLNPRKAEVLKGYLKKLENSVEKWPEK